MRAWSARQVEYQTFNQGFQSLIGIATFPYCNIFSHKHDERKEHLDFKYKMIGFSPIKISIWFARIVCQGFAGSRKALGTRLV